MSEQPPHLPEPSTGLLVRASGWFDAAMNAWSNGDHEKVTGLAPLAVELTTKAYLWKVAPTLLVPLDSRHEHSLIALATGAKIDDPKLRTVGLSESMRRALSVADTEPKVGKTQRERLVASRNGSVHLGGVPGDISRHVLTDSIRLITWLLGLLGAPESEYFGSHQKDCQALLEQGRSETAQMVLARLAKHRKQFEALLSRLHDSVAEQTLTAMEATALNERRPGDESAAEIVTARSVCPACARMGAIHGPFELEAEGEAEYEDGGYTYHAIVVTILFPEWFTCNVCGLRLAGPLELEAAGVSIDPYAPDEEDLAFVPTIDDEWYGDNR